MNSSDDLPINGLPEERDEACSSVLTDSDKNANVSNQSKGAIPKTKPLKRFSSHKLKLNNNNELVQNGHSEKTYQTPCENDSCNGLCDCALSKPSTSCIRDSTDCSSSDEHELLSISDDGCIYTFKTDDAADLPSSFYNLNIVRSPEASPPRRDNVSPEMDFLEMDFDPGPSGSGDADSDSLSIAEGESADNLPQDPCCSNVDIDVNVINTCEEPQTKCDNKETISIKNSEQANLTPILVVPPYIPSPLPTDVIQPVRMPWSCSFRQRTSNNSYNYIRLTKYHDSYEGELSYLSAIDEFGCDKRLEQVMIWSEQEACIKQVTQIAPSSCGATAVINVLNALRFPVPTIEKVQSIVKTRYRAVSSSLAQYLLSRSDAGSTHEDIILGLNQLSEHKIYSRFFHMYPERVLNLNWWLQYWISKGAVPVATLNLQKSVGAVPDAWHHQMIFGVGPCGVYLTNPLECVKSELIWPQLSSESILLIRREDVLCRWIVNPALDELMEIRDPKWTTLNVVGQVANMVRESHREYRPGFVTTSHIKIPASYCAGITLSVRKDSSAYKMLKCCPELPLLPPGEVCSTDIF